MNIIKLIRPVNLLIIVITMYLFRYCIVVTTSYKLFYIKQVMTDVQFFILVLTTVFIATGGYIINDIFDVEIDNTNRPNKVIIGNTISETQAYNFYKILCSLAIICTIVLAFLTKNFRLSTLPIIIMVILNFYAYTFKKQLIVGNFMIALCTSFTIFLIALFENSLTEGTENEWYVRSGIAIAAIVYGTFAFLTTFLREIIKDAEDIIGDEQSGAKTIPIVFGTKGTKVASFIICFLLLLFLGSFIWFFPNIQVKNVSLFIIIGMVLPLFIIFFFIFRANSTKNYHFVSNLIKVFMCIGIGTMLYFRTGIGPYIFVQYANFIKKLF